jgi:hypothetical protein
MSTDHPRMRVLHCAVLDDSRREGPSRDGSRHRKALVRPAIRAAARSPAHRHRTRRPSVVRGGDGNALIGQSLKTKRLLAIVLLRAERPSASRSTAPLFTSGQVASHDGDCANCAITRDRSLSIPQGSAPFTASNRRRFIDRACAQQQRQMSRGRAESKSPSASLHEGKTSAHTVPLPRVEAYTLYAAKPSTPSASIHSVCVSPSPNARGAPSGRKRTSPASNSAVK